MKYYFMEIDHNRSEEMPLSITIFKAKEGINSLVTFACMVHAGVSNINRRDLPNN